MIPLVSKSDDKLGIDRKSTKIILKEIRVIENKMFQISCFNVSFIHRTPLLHRDFRGPVPLRKTCKKKRKIKGKKVEVHNEIDVPYHLCLREHLENIFRIFGHYYLFCDSI